MFPTREIWGSNDKILNALPICLLQNLNQILLLLFYTIRECQFTTPSPKSNIFLFTLSLVSANFFFFNNVFLIN